MKTKAIVAGAVVLMVLLFLTIPLIVFREPPQAITVRHVKSVQSGDITLMTFEITNHTTDSYAFFPYEVQVRNGNAWTRLQGFDSHQFVPFGQTCLVHYHVNVANLPAESVLRLCIHPARKLLGLSGLFKRARMNLQNYQPHVSLNPYDKNSDVYGNGFEVTSDEFVETVK